MDHIRLKTMLEPDPPKSMRIGRDRTAELTLSGAVEFKLYDAAIFVYDKEARRAVLDLCGFWTSAVVSAQKEYALACGLDISPSIKRGQYLAIYRGNKHLPGHNGKITIEF